MWFFMFSPTIIEWQSTLAIAQNDLLNPKEAMEALLIGIREDVDKQFDENQGKWRPLAKFTVERKKSLDADPRILHETNARYSGQDNLGLRLRDAYLKTGSVSNTGILIYTYPAQKPYAKDHQEGIAGTTPKRTGRSRTGRPNARERSQQQRELDRLDALFDRLFDD